jgi:RNA polymerase sigma-70 factor (ECF subfamily)
MMLAVDASHVALMRDTAGDDIARAVGGDVLAFERLYQANVGRVYALALRMAGPRVADELAQDVFVRVWQKLALFRGESAFSTWLHRLAVNVIVEHFRRENLARQRMTTDLALDVTPARSSSPTAKLGLEAALELLPDGARRVFVLFDVEGYTHQEIASLLGTTVGTSKSQLHRARMLLREQLSSRDHEV